MRLEGVIAAGARGGSAGGVINVARTSKLFEKAFSQAHASAVVILINSPSGSPVQSRLIHDRIRQLAAEKKKTVTAHCEDYAASGGYMIACAGDEIWCDPASIMGSIGVVSPGFGFPELMKRIGVERRLQTGGDKKAMLDPFSEQGEAERARLQAILDDLHGQFIDLVKSRRGDKLADDPDLFSGMIFTGAEAVKNGLADETTDLRAKLRERFGRRAKFQVLAPPRPGPLSRLMGGAADAVVDRLEARLFGWGGPV